MMAAARVMKASWMSSRISPSPGRVELPLRVPGFPRRMRQVGFGRQLGDFRPLGEGGPAGYRDGRPQTPKVKPLMTSVVRCTPR